MKIIFDVCYLNTVANVAAILFDDYTSDKIIEKYSITIPEVTAEYIPGQFYKKEMPCLITLWNSIPENIKQQIDTVIVDGLYDLWDGKPGMGHHFHDWLTENNYNVDVIGIAKKKFKENSSYIIKVTRGIDSTIPLNVNGSNKSINYEKLIKSMYGKYRIPFIVKEVDKLSRGLMI